MMHIRRDGIQKLPTHCMRTNVLDMHSSCVCEHLHTCRVMENSVQPVFFFNEIVCKDQLHDNLCYAILI